MRFLIEIAGEDQRALIRALDEVRARLMEGGCYLNACGCVDAKLRPESAQAEHEFQAQYDLAHPKPQAKWTKEPCAK